MKPIPLLILLMLTLGQTPSNGAEPAPLLSGQAPGSANPILPGYYADPSVVQADGKSYIYATLDPFGDKTLGCWESFDFKNWTYRPLNWPTKEACTTPESGNAGVWAPSVIHAPDGRYHMAVSVGNEVWLGVADSPLGPWQNSLGDKPFIPKNYKPGFHMIDAEFFVDDDQQVYLYWGSGWDWKNGRCFAAKLNTDLTAFDGEVKDVTPGHYFEAPIMVKRHGRYFLMYSDGVTIRDTYQVHYAVGDSPFGPFTEGPNSPILVTDKSINLISPGHHTVVRRDDRDYILYHRHSIPFDPKFIGRQICIDELTFTAEGRIETVKPTHEGPALVQDRAETRNLAAKAAATASSQATEHTAPAFVLDANYATRWAAAPDAQGAWLQLDLGEPKEISRQLIQPEYAWKPFPFVMEFSDDGKAWKQLADFSQDPPMGSPIAIEKGFTARHVRLVFPENLKGSAISLFEWSLF